MPLLRISDVSASARLGLWEMTDHLADYEELLSEARQRFKSEARQREYVCVRALLRRMTGDESLSVSHLPSGKPQLSNGMHVSISHTKKYCAVILSEQNEVAVDVEYISNRVERIASRILREDEVASDTMALLLHWCAKETLYKLFSDDQLELKAMYLNPFVAAETGTLLAQNLKRRQLTAVHYRVSTEFVLTWAELS